jgi:hypothetical protein
MENLDEKNKSFLEKYDVRCEICGKRSITFDSWFNYQPCEDHQHLTPNEYNEMKRNKK